MKKKDLIVGNYFYYNNEYYQLNSIKKDRVYFGTKNEWGFYPNTSVEDFLYYAIPEKKYKKPDAYKEEPSDDGSKLIDAISDYYERQGI